MTRVYLTKWQSGSTTWPHNLVPYVDGSKRGPCLQTSEALGRTDGLYAWTDHRLSEPVLDWLEEMGIEPTLWITYRYPERQQDEYRIFLEFEEDAGAILFKLAWVGT